MEAQEQIKRFGEFIEKKYKSALLQAARKGEKFLVIDFAVLSRFDSELAEGLLDNPTEFYHVAQIAVEQFQLPQDTKGFSVRFRNLPATQEVMISDIRSEHIGKLLSFKGVIRQKSEVRPQVTSARFECPTCGNIITVLQLDQKFKEPTRCGCGRKGKFRLLSKELVDAQRLTLEEAPEDLEGGEQPKRMNVFLEKDLVSPFTEKRNNPGTKVMVTGVVKEVPITLRDGAQSIRFDLVIDSNWSEPVEEDFSEIIIKKEEEDKIKELAKDPKVMEKLVASIAPGIYGHAMVKQALVLQFFGGVRKVRDDGVTTRGDMHVLLIGDPGAGKCLSGDMRVMLGDGSILPLRDIAGGFSNGDNRKASINLPTLGLDGKFSCGNAIRVWRRKHQGNLLIIRTRTGKVLKATKNHPFFISDSGFIVAKDSCDLKVGDRIAGPRRIRIDNPVQILPRSEGRVRSHNSKRYRFPEVVTKELSRLLGYLCGDGCLAYSQTSGWNSLANNNQEVARDFSQLVKLLFGADLTVRKEHGGKAAKEAYLNEKSVVEYFSAHFGELTGGPSGKDVPIHVLRSPDDILAEFIKALFECDAHINIKKRQIEYRTTSKNLAESIQYSLLRYGIVALLREKSKSATNTRESRGELAYDVIISGEFAKEYHEQIGFISKDKETRLARLFSGKAYNTNIDLVPGVNKLLKKVRIGNGLGQKDMGIPRPTFAHYEQGNRLPSISTLKKISKHLKTTECCSKEASLLDMISESDIFWDEILSIEESDNEEPFVYDLEVAQVHNFIANGVVVHNSQLLKRSIKVAPKSRYVSGKGVSGAGLTATVVKDEFLRGWSLEAGALVLANKGFCMIDEMDKMTPEDRSAMHEALEQQTVSISKANIQATLRAETTVLAAANPKFGRFNPYDMIANQIDLPPTLINRFDLIFPIRDLPDRDRDTEMAGFILSLHESQIAGEVPISTEILRKFIAYARQNIKPKLTKDAMKTIQDFYVSMRSAGMVDEGSGVQSIPISPRQLEALIRMAEASARTRLSKEVSPSDAQRAIDILNHCLEQVGLDRETGKIDIDRIASGISATQRNKISVIKEVISSLESKVGKIIAIEDIEAAAQEKGVDPADVEEVLEKLKRSGDIFEPKRGSIQRI